VILASASPRNPKVDIVDKSSNVDSLEVVNRSQTIGKSSLCIPCPLSWICSSCNPPPS
jgi:hypothetical protein